MCCAVFYLRLLAECLSIDLLAIDLPKHLVVLFSFFKKKSIALLMYICVCIKVNGCASASPTHVCNFLAYCTRTATWTKMETKVRGIYHSSEMASLVVSSFEYAQFLF